MEAVWQVRALPILRTVAPYLTRHLVGGIPQEDVWAMMHQLVQPTAKGFAATIGEGTKLYAAVCPLPMRLRHLYCCRLMELVHAKQPSDPRLQWRAIVVDGTSRHEASYIHCVLWGTSRPNQLSSWPLVGVSEHWATMHAATEGADFDQQLWDGTKVISQDTPFVVWRTMFFLSPNGMAPVLIANS